MHKRKKPRDFIPLDEDDLSERINVSLHALPVLLFRKSRIVTDGVTRDKGSERSSNPRIDEVRLGAVYAGARDPERRAHIPIIM